MSKIDEYILAQGFGIDSELALSAFFLGVEDGKEQGDELGVGMTYEDLNRQQAYDIGTRVGATIKTLELLK